MEHQGSGDFPSGEDRSARAFLFLQGPHGPFFAGLAKMLRATGARVWRVGFNAGDRAFWFGSTGYIPFRDRLEAWPDRFDQLLTELGVSDIVLYGDIRPVHAAAVRAARARGLRVHVFEEGYLRPYWVTYERGGSNGHSRLMEMTVAELCAARSRADSETPPPPAHWGDTRQHVFYGALYHWFVMFANRGYRNFRPHRDLPVSREFLLYLRQLLLMPLHRVERGLTTARIRRGGYPYHLALLQLEHDASFRAHSPFSTTLDFLNEVMAGFAAGAPRHHHLVIKAHPLEPGRVPIRHEAARLAAQHGIAGRVHFVRGGKLAQLLDDARSAVTVNSTAGQQVLWRGIPLKIFGRAVYDKPEFVSDQTVARFFDNPRRPDGRAYRAYRRMLLETSQLPGSFYSRKGRRQLLRHVVDLMLADSDPYDTRLFDTEAPRQQLRLVR